VDRQVLDPDVAPKAKKQSEDADQQPRQQDLVPGEAEKVPLVQVGQPEVYLAPRPVLGRARGLGYVLGGKGGEYDRT
jgi:hypothetical protein